MTTAAEAVGRADAGATAQIAWSKRVRAVTIATVVQLVASFSSEQGQELPSGRLDAVHELSVSIGRRPCWGWRESYFANVRAQRWL